MYSMVEINVEYERGQCIVW